MKMNKKNLLTTAAGLPIVAASLLGIYDQVTDYSIGAVYQTLEEGVTPQPEVNSSTGDSLIALNDATREAGPYVFYGTLLALGALSVAVSTNKKLSTMNEGINYENKSNKRERGVNVFLLALTIGTTAVASGIGDQAGEGANRPIDELVSQISDDNEEITFITQHSDVIPFNHSEVSVEEYEATIRALDAENAVPYTLILGSLKNNNNDNNPSSAPIVAIPDAIFNEHYVSETSNCTNIPRVAVGEQIGAEIGSLVEMEGIDACVTSTLDIAPGLDRVAVVTSLDDIQELITKGEEYSGIVIADDKLDFEAIQEILHDQNIDLDAQSLDQFKQSYTNFWDRSVKPPEMQLVLYVALTSSVAVMYVGLSSFFKRRSRIADEKLQGVNNTQLLIRELIRNAKDTGVSLPFATALGYGLTASTNSSQYGFEQAFNVTSLGSGMIFAITASVASSAASSLLTNKLKPSEELR